MDRGTLLGLLLGVTFVAGAVLLGPASSAFWNPSAILIVVGGTLATTFVKFPMGVVRDAVSISRAAFQKFDPSTIPLIRSIVHLSRDSRRGGLLSLQEVDADDDFLVRAIGLAVDGADSEFLENVLRAEIAGDLERYDRGERVFRAMGQAAPAFGMIGTLIGLVQMLARMDDPSKIGGSMAVAILTTLYGAALAYIFFIPIADKLNERARSEHLRRELTVQGVLAILGGYHPHLVERHLFSMILQIDLIGTTPLKQPKPGEGGPIETIDQVKRVA